MHVGLTFIVAHGRACDYPAGGGGQMHACVVHTRWLASLFGDHVPSADRHENLGRLISPGFDNQEK